MKTLDEIKKGLECCNEDGCSVCPYSIPTNYSGRCIKNLMTDSLDYIKLLEDGIEQWELVAASPGAVEDMARDNERLEAEVANLERVRSDLTATNAQLRDAVFKNELFKRRLEEERSVFEARLPRWISVEERLPQDDEMYLVYTTEHTCAVYRYWGDGEWETEWGEDASHNITHWMPLPAAPKEVQHE